MTPVEGGLTHRMYRVDTGHGTFAVKEISIDPEGTWQAPWIERAFALEQNAFGAGLPMPRPVAVPSTGACLAEVPREDGSLATIRVHEWLDGEGLRNVVYGTDFAERTAGVIARIHALEMGAEETLAQTLRVTGLDHWEALTERVEQSTLPWRWELRSLIPTIVELESYIEASRSDTSPLIFSHRDADQKNWMKTPQGDLFLVDWDAAGPILPRHDVANTALAWAGIHLGEPDWKVVRTWVRAYRAAGGQLERFVAGDLAEFVTVAIWWFEHNVRRSLGETGGDESDEQRAIAFARREFKSLPRILRSLERWERALADE
jgi:hypothetical protein